jgi:NAD-dependent dihydropyrimidine dehydrogenase PreA subunit
MTAPGAKGLPRSPVEQFRSVALAAGAGVEGLWTPYADTGLSGCDPTCNNCGQACPTGAIRALPLAEKRAARMGLAVVDERTCLPHAGTGACTFCVEACLRAGHQAMEFLDLPAQVDEQGQPVPDSVRRTPVVLKDKCVGCGLCQARCQAGCDTDNAGGMHPPRPVAIVVQAGKGREDRLLRGSYLALRKARTATAPASPATKPSAGTSSQPATKPAGGTGYVTDF